MAVRGGVVLTMDIKDYGYIIHLRATILKMSFSERYCFSVTQSAAFICAMESSIFFSAWLGRSGTFLDRLPFFFSYLPFPAV